MPEIDLETILSVYEGRNIFSIYFDQIQVYEQIHSQLTDQEFEPEENFQGAEIENSFLRRLLQVLRLPATDLNREGKKGNTDEEDLEEKVTGCIESCKRCLNNDYDQNIGELGFKSIL